MTNTRTKTADATKAPTNLQSLIDLLRRPEGGDDGGDQLAARSVRGALAGTLERKGTIESEKLEGRRIYRIARRSAG
jgi:hypothetical protein